MEELMRRLLLALVVVAALPLLAIALYQPALAVPLGPGKGFPGLGGAKMTLVVRDDQSRGDLARTLVEQLITVNKVHFINGEGTSGTTSIIQPVVEGYGI